MSSAGSNAGPMSSRRPYLLRAMHEWMNDNLQTPHLVVNAGAEGVAVPRQYVHDGKIVLNISYHATNGLTMGNEQVEFNARFGGQTQHVRVPMHAVLGIYARETGQGMVFSDEDAPQPTPPPTPPTGVPESSGAASDGNAKPLRSRAQLKIVK